MGKVIVFFVLILSTSLLAVDYFMPTTMGNSAYAKGVGVIGFENSAVSVLENPAKLSDIREYSLSGFTTTVMDDFAYRNLAFAKRLGPHWAVGVGYAELGVDGIPHTDLVWDNFDDEFTVIELSNYAYRNYVVKAAFQYLHASKVSIGSALSYYRTSLWTTHGNGINVDAALQYRSISGLTEVSVVATNVIPNLVVTYDNGAKETLPMRTSLGVKRQVRSFDVYWQLMSPTLSESLYLWSFGVEYQCPKVPLRVLGTRYQFDVFDDVRVAYATGLQLDLHGLKVSYSFEKSDYPLTDNNHYFSVSFGQ